MAVSPPVCDFGWKAVDFALPGVDGKTYTLKDVAGPNGLLLMFICNHCPYVQAVIERIVRDVRELRGHNLERIADRCTNICERVIYTVTGHMQEINISKY